MKQAVDLRSGGGHLPPGREPGIQSRRGARRRRFGVTLLTLLSGAMLAGALTLFVIAAHTKTPAGARIGGAILGGGAIILFAVLRYLLGRLHPRQARHLQLAVTPRECARGDSLTASLLIRNPRRLGDELKLGLVCTEYYDELRHTGGDRERVTVPVDVYDEWTAPNRNLPHQTVDLSVPFDAPFSYEGATVSWAWHVAAIDRRGRRHQRRRDVAIWVTP